MSLGCRERQVHVEDLIQMCAWVNGMLGRAWREKLTRAYKQCHLDSSSVDLHFSAENSLSILYAEVQPPSSGQHWL